MEGKLHKDGMTKQLFRKDDGFEITRFQDHCMQDNELSVGQNDTVWNYKMDLEGLPVELYNSEVDQSGLRKHMDNFDCLHNHGTGRRSGHGSEHEGFYPSSPRRHSSELEDQIYDEHRQSMQSIVNREKDNDENCLNLTKVKIVPGEKSPARADILGMKSKGEQSLEESSMGPKPECSKPGDDRHGSSSSSVGDGDPSASQENAGFFGKRTRSRWEPQNESGAETTEGDATFKIKKLRWVDDDSKLKILGPMQLPDFVRGLTSADDNDPEVQMLKMQLSEIGRKLQGGQLHDAVIDGAGSPSPEPIYDSLGVRINTREFRILEKLTRKRQEIISKLIQKNPTFKPPVDYKSPTLYKKLYIPVNVYPDYNFIGLIIGPRGNTQKRMEKETGAKIIIRGKGSVKVKERKNQKKCDMKLDFSENEDLHVFIEAENQQSLDAAVNMVEKLLVPLDDGLNEHKQAQLRELAELNGTVRHDDFCKLLGEHEHGGYACPNRSSTFRSDICHICGDRGHPSIDCCLKVSTQRNKMGNECYSSLAEHNCGGRGGLIGQTGPDHHPAAPVVASWGGSSMLATCSGYDSSLAPGLGSIPMPNHRKGRKFDETNIYVAYLPQTIDSEQLMHLFSPFGRVLEAKVIKDRRTGLSKGYGFVKYRDEETAFCAVTHMNGYRIDGRVLAVRIAARAPPTVAPGYGLAGWDTKQSASALLSSSIVDSSAWSGPPGSKLPASYASYSSNNDTEMSPSLGYVGRIDSFSRHQSSSFHGAHHVPKAYPECHCA